MVLINPTILIVVFLVLTLNLLNLNIYFDFLYLLNFWWRIFNRFLTFTFIVGLILLLGVADLRL